MEADMSLMQVALLRQIAEDMLDANMKQDPQWLKRNMFATHPKVPCKVSHRTQQDDAKGNEHGKRCEKQDTDESNDQRGSSSATCTPECLGRAKSVSLGLNRNVMYKDVIGFSPPQCTLYVISKKSECLQLSLPSQLLARSKGFQKR